MLPQIRYNLHLFYSVLKKKKLKAHLCKSSDTTWRKSKHSAWNAPKVSWISTSLRSSPPPFPHRTATWAVPLLFLVSASSVLSVSNRWGPSFSSCSDDGSKSWLPCSHGISAVQAVLVLENRGGGAMAGNIRLAAKQGQHTPMRNFLCMTTVDLHFFPNQKWVLDSTTH